MCGEDDPRVEKRPLPMKGHCGSQKLPWTLCIHRAIPSIRQYRVQVTNSLGRIRARSSCKIYGSEL